MGTISKMLSYGKEAASNVKNGVSNVKKFIGKFNPIVRKIKLICFTGVLILFAVVYLSLLVYVVKNNHSDFLKNAIVQTFPKTHTSSDLLETLDSTESDYPRYRQDDSSWCDEIIKSPNENDTYTVKDAGSGVCAIAGALSKITGKQITPLQLIDLELGELSDLTTDNIENMAIQYGNYFNCPFTLGAGGGYSSERNLLDDMTNNNNVIAIVKNNEQVAYICKSSNEEKKVKLVNSKSSGKEVDAYYNGDTTIDKFLDSSWKIVGYYSYSENSENDE